MSAQAIPIPFHTMNTATTTSKPFWQCSNDEYYFRMMFSSPPSANRNSSGDAEWKQLLQEYRNLQRHRVNRFKPISNADYYRSIGCILFDNIDNNGEEANAAAEDEKRFYKDLRNKKQPRSRDVAPASGSSMPISATKGMNILSLLATEAPFILTSALAPFLTPQALARLAMTNKDLLRALDGCDIRFDKVEDDQRSTSNQFLIWLEKQSGDVAVDGGASQAAAPSSQSASITRTKPMINWRITGIHISSLNHWNLCANNPELQTSVEYITMKGDVVQALNGAMPDVSMFSRLGSVELLGWANLASLEALARSAAHLHTLKIEYTRNLEDIKAISLCKKLRRFEIKWCPGLKAIDPLGMCVHLSDLSLSGCKAKYESLSALVDSRELVSLNVHDSPYLTNIDTLRNLGSLRFLDISSCKLLTNLEPLSSLRNLIELNLADNISIENLNVLKNLRQLRKLNVSKCPQLSDITSVSVFGLNLEQLDMSCCPLLRDIAEIRFLQRLSDLSLRSCSGLSSVEALSQCRNVRKMDLSDCMGVEDISSLGEIMANLQHLILSDSSVNDLSGLCRCPNLARIDAARCKNLADISCLPTFPKLVNIELDEKFRDMQTELRSILPNLEIRFAVR